jgi:hypothetical protein
MSKKLFKRLFKRASQSLPEQQNAIFEALKFT